MNALEQFKDKKQKLLNEQIAKRNGEQLQLDEIANQEFKWGEERRYDEAEQYIYDEDGIVPLED